jgi:hypothetical protein
MVVSYASLDLKYKWVMQKLCGKYEDVIRWYLTFRNSHKRWADEPGILRTHRRDLQFKWETGWLMRYGISTRSQESAEKDQFLKPVQKGSVGKG